MLNPPCYPSLPKNVNLIRRITAREILDSRGNPTLEVEMDCDKCIARASVPSGASTGSHEACELRDGDPKRYHGKGVLKAAENVNGTIRNAFFQKDVDLMSQREFDTLLLELDGTSQKTNLGANAMLGCSLAFAKAKAYSQSVSLYRYAMSLSTVPCAIDTERFVLPTPMVNILNGGVHANSGLEIQEFMVIPADFPTATDAIRAASEIFHTLKSLLAKAGLATSVGDEGGFAPMLRDNDEALSYIVQAIEASGYRAGQQVFIGLDCAASEYHDAEKSSYSLKVEGQKRNLDSAQLAQYYSSLIAKYPILSIEDPFAEDDWEGFSHFMGNLPRKVQVVGDDLFVTQSDRVQKGINLSAANALLVKLNQVGTVTETIDAVNLAQKNKWGTIMSHRSGETEDTYLVDFAIGFGTGQIKTGSMSRGERIVKYNQLLRIEEREGDKAMYAGKKAFMHLL